MGINGPGSFRVCNTLAPKLHVKPAAEFEPGLMEATDLGKSKFFVDSFAHWIWAVDEGIGVNISLLCEYIQQF